MIVKIKKIVLIGFLLIIAVFQQSCNEEPTYMGSTLLLDTISIYPISTSTHRLITNIESYRFYEQSFNKGVFHIGKYNDYETFAMMRFYEPLKNVDSLDYLSEYTADKILSCKLFMPLERYTFGDSVNSNALSFKVYKAVSYWSNLSTWDSLEINGVIEKSKIIAEFSGEIIQQDTMQTLSLDFDKELILDWFKQWVEFKNADSIDKPNYTTWGIAFVPEQNSNVIRTFKGPKIGEESDVSNLEIIYIDKEGEQDTLNIESGVEKSFYKIPEYVNDDIEIQGSVQTRALLSFDVSVIPPLSAIHTAQLELTLNRDKCIYGNYNIDSTLSGGLPVDSNEYLEENFIRNYYAEKDFNIFYFTSITSAVSHWNRETNGKGVITLYSEGDRNLFWELDKLVFYGLKAQDSSKRPKLTIIYSERPDFERK